MTSPTDPAFWTDHRLDQLMHRGDPEADAVVAERAAQRPDLEPAELVGAIAAHLAMPDGHQSPSVAGFLREQPDLPAWADPVTMQRSAAFFELYGLEIGLALFCASLPEGYASARGAKVLTLTARLVTDPVRRVYETAQFLMDCMTAGGLVPGEGAGYHDIRRVRLMHAAVRRLITTDPSVALVDDPHPEGSAWYRGWGVPLNQEDMLGALLTFTTAVFESLDRMGAKYPREDAEAYLHTWCVVGHLLGIEPELLPLSLDSAKALTAAIRRRNWAESADGRELGGALMGALENSYELRMLKGLPASIIHWYTGTEVAGIVGAHQNWTRLAFAPLRGLLRIVSLDELHNRLLRSITRRSSKAVLLAFVNAGRGHGTRPAFSMPAHLHAKVHRPPQRWTIRFGKTP